jgi:hypothetical protein
MKTTVEAPDALFRKAKATTAEQGILLKNFFSSAVRTTSSAPPAKSPVAAQRRRLRQPAWMSAFGGLRHPHNEPNALIVSWRKSSSKSTRTSGGNSRHQRFFRLLRWG